MTIDIVGEGASQASRAADTNESLRQQVLQRYAILDTPPQACFDRIVRIAAQAFKVPIALISLVDKERLWCKARCGLEQAEFPLADTFCDHTIAEASLLVVPDATRDQRFRHKPLVTGEHGLHFYAAAPLQSPEGVTVGTLCVFDRAARHDFDACQAALLEDMAALVVDQLEAQSKVVHRFAERETQALTLAQQSQNKLEQSQRFMSTVLESIEDGIVACDADGQLSLFNAATRRFHGLPEHPLPPDAWAEHYDLFCPDGKTPLPTAEIPLFRALQGEQVRDAEMMVIPKSGSPRRLRATGRALYDPSGHKLGAVVSMHDITEKVHAEARFRHLYNHTPALMHSIDTEGYIISVSDYWLETLGYRRDEVIGRRLTEFMTEDCYLEAVHVHLPAFLRQGYCRDIPHTFVKKSGDVMHVLLSAIADRNQRGDITRSLSVMVDVTEQSRLQTELRHSERQFRSAFEASPHAMALVSPEGRFLQVNPALCHLLGYSESELLQRDFQSLTHPDDLIAESIYLHQLVTGKLDAYAKEKRYRHKEGHYVWGHRSVTLVCNDAGKATHLVTQFVDMTELKDKDAQLLQAQKLEAVGQLSGGIAHDFNNLLSVVVGNLELVERSPALDDKNRRRLRSAMKSAQRGADLTRRLLAFSRKQPLEPEQLDLQHFLAELNELLHRTLGEHIELAIDAGPDLWPIKADAGQLEAALLNLAINARDAMPSGGQLFIAADNTYLDTDYATAHPALMPGDYVVISVSDTGAGIGKDLLAQVFEPFFTTKAPGKGSGLGLSMVHGFVKQSGGNIKAYSEEGVGTTIKLYLPRAGGRLEPAQLTNPQRPAEAATDIVGGQKTILVVDDDPEVRAVGASLLQELGYRVLEATSGSEALSLLANNTDIDLLFSDIVMPGINGVELASQARRTWPHLKVLHCSGFADAAVMRNGTMSGVTHLLSKPYSKAALAQKVREVLKSPAPVISDSP